MNRGTEVAKLSHTVELLEKNEADGNQNRNGTTEHEGFGSAGLDSLLDSTR